MLRPEANKGLIVAHAENSIVIKKPAAEIYAFLADGLNNPKWRPGVESITLASGSAGSAGAVYQLQLTGPGGRLIAGDYRITAAEAGRELAFEVVAGLARPTGVYRLEVAPEGTRVSFVLDFAPRGLMKLMGPMIQKTMESEVGQLAGLKAVLEGSAKPE
jgi:uncharacterized membrane protein